MKTLLLIVLGTLVASCRLDNLLRQPGGSPPPSASRSLRLVSTAQSAAFDVVPGPATQLAFTTQPSRTAPGSPITPPVRITALDALGNKATNFTGVVRVALGRDGSPLSNAQLSGSTTAPVSDGVATFADLRIDQIGTGYTLTSAFGAASPIAESAPFDVAVV